MMVVNILLVLNVSAYYSTVAEGSILILAVLAGELRPGFTARSTHPQRPSRNEGVAQGHLASQRTAEARFLLFRFASVAIDGPERDAGFLRATPRRYVLRCPPMSASSLVVS